MNKGLISVANELQNGTDRRCQGKLYFSMQSHQAFRLHFDEHDVFEIYSEF